ncbi:alpha-glucosidase [Aureobasidium pullulans]|nr:alpha-glucosidase [Aureobasidium pullulans]
MPKLDVIKSERVWWKESVVYQIYPASFRDTNGDGFGDVRGITSKLDYLKNLGVYKSPQVDMGYDISDYMDIDPIYGSLTDVDELIAELAKRDMKLMMDLVVNHTSDQVSDFSPLHVASKLTVHQHSWFLDSRSSIDHPKRDWYFWRKGRVDKDGKLGPPNNWCRTLDTTKSAWQWDEKTQEYYLSIFSPEQPDLNWDNDEVRSAVHDILRFWLDRGVCGFRMDVIDHISKVQRPLNMVFLFKLLNMDNEPGQSKWSYHEWDATDMKRIHERTQRLMIDRDGWNAIFNENHDGPRSISRFADDSDEWRAYSAKMLCTKAATLGGTEYIYQGQELGMRNIPPDWTIEEYKDIESQNYWAAASTQYANNHRKLDYARKLLQLKARDHTRTPMQWDSSPNGGFCKADVKPWMRVNDDYTAINAATQLKDPESVLSYWKRCLEFRQKHKDTFIYGGFEVLDPEDKDVVAFVRFSEHESYVTVTNFTGKHVNWSGLGDVKVKKWVIGNYGVDDHNKDLSSTVYLKPWEAQAKYKNKKRLPHTPNITNTSLFIAHTIQVLKCRLLECADSGASIGRIISELTIKSIAIALLDLSQINLTRSRDQISSSIGNLITLTLDSGNGLADTLKSLFLISTNLSTSIGSVIGELPINGVTVTLLDLRKVVLTKSGENVGGSVGNLVGLTLGLCGAADESCSVVFGVFDTIPNAIVGAAQDGRASVALACELASADLAALDQSCRVVW